MSVDRRATGSRGFSLLEALVATAVLAALLVSALDVFAGAVSRDNGAEVRLRTLRRAHDLIRLTTTEFGGVFGSVSGQDASVRWTVETAPLRYSDSKRRPDRSGPVPVRLNVIVAARRAVPIRLDTVFLFEDARR